jgi:hypothetical protein
MTSDDAEDPTFSSLPPRVQERIDRAFDLATINHGSSPKKITSHVAESLTDDQPGGGFIPEPQAGGFMLDEPGGGFIAEEPSGGFIPEELSDGFMPEESDGVFANDPDLQHNNRGSDTSRGTSTIPLSLIPTALQILDLPPDDEQVLAVFNNAASGWTSSRSHRTRDDADEVGLVSKKDWRAVCSVLLASQPADEEDADESDGMADSGEEYMNFDGDENDSDSGGEDLEDEDYSETQTKNFPQTQTKLRRSRQPTRRSSDEELTSHPPITARQKEACRGAFALFFPHVSDSQLDSQKITISDLVRVSKDLKEKLSYDQVGSIVVFKVESWFNEKL